MKMRVPLQTVVVMRDGKTHTPAIGTPFEFEDDEVSDIERMNPDALGKDATVDVSATDEKTMGKKVKGSTTKPADDSKTEGL